MDLKNKRLKRIIAFILAILLCINTLPGYGIEKVSATVMDSYTILLECTEENKEGISVTLTNKENMEQKKTVETDEDGKAVFGEGFVDSNTTYHLKITGRIGYENYESEITGTDITGTEYIVDLSQVPELEQILLQGKVVDEQGNPVPDVMVEYIAYEGRLTNQEKENLEVLTDEKGEYSFEVYEGIEYTMDFIKDGYAVSSDQQIKITAMDEADGNVLEEDGKKTVTAEEVRLQHHTYEVTASSVVGTEDWGSIQVKDEKVMHGENAEIFILPKEGYKVTEIEDTSVEERKDSISENLDGYGSITYIRSDITEDTEVKVGFSEVEGTNKSWKEVLEVSNPQGLFLDETREDGIYVYGNAAGQVTIRAKEEGHKINVKSNAQYSGWVESVTITEDVTIEKIQIASENIWNRKNVTFEENKQLKIAFLDHKPSIELEKIENAKEIEGNWWITQDTKDVIISGKIFDDLRASHLVWSTDKLDGDTILNTWENRVEIVTNEEGEETFSFTADVQIPEGKNEVRYYLYGINKMDNISDEMEIIISKDTGNPKVQGFLFEKKEDSTIEGDIYSKDFGTYFPEEIEVTVEITEGESSPGLEKIQLYHAGEETATPVVETTEISKSEVLHTETGKKEMIYTATFLLDPEKFNGKEVFVQAIDRLGNTSGKTKPTEVEESKRNVSSDRVFINTEKAEIETSQEEPVYVKEKDGVLQKWYNKHITHTITAKTTNEFLGVRSLNLKVEEQDSSIQEEEFSTLQKEVTKNISTVKEGKNTIMATAMTNAGIFSETKLETYIDLAAPAIRYFNIEKISENKVLQFFSFGIFGNEKVKVTITADDSRDGGGNPLEDYSGVETIILQVENKLSNEIKEYQATVLEENKAVFVIPAEDVEIVDNSLIFQGNISAKATDYVGHTTQDWVIPTVENANITDSNELIIETIKPTVELVSDTQLYLEERETGEVKKWSGQDVAYHLNITDEHSGINSVAVFVNEESVRLTEISKENETPESTTEDTKIGKISSQSFLFHVPVRSDPQDAFSIKVIAIDNAGNQQTSMYVNYQEMEELNPFTTEEEIIYGDVKAPKVELSGKETGISIKEEMWYGQDVVYQVNVGDEHSGIYSIHVDINGTMITTDKDGKTIGTRESFQISTSQANRKKEDNSYEITVTVKDNTGNSHTEKVMVYKDTQVPTITNFQFEKIEGNKALNFLTFGNFGNGAVKVTVTAQDVEKESKKYSGVKTITLYGNGKELETLSVDENQQAIFTIPMDKIINENTLEFHMELSASVSDMVGNSSEKIKPSELDSKLSDTFLLETILPEVSLQSKVDTKNFYTDNQGNQWYGKEVAYEVLVKDENAGIRNVVVTISNHQKKTNITENLKSDSPSIDTKFDQKQTKAETFEISTSQVHTAVDGSYTISSEVTDNAGNVNQQETTIYLDTHAPDITNFKIEKLEKKKIINFLTFGIFGNERIKITVTADDSKDENGKSLPAYSDVKTITLYGGSEVLKTSKVDKNHQAVFTIPSEKLQNNKKQFDQVISAKATDQVGHTTGIPVMPSERNSNIKNSGIMIETKKPTISLETDGIVYKEDVDGKKRSWCDQDINYDLVVGDADSGIRSVEVTINGIKVTKNLKRGGKSISTDFYKSKTKKEEFRISTRQGKINPDGSYKIEAIVTDNAGNVRTVTKTVYKDVNIPSMTMFTFQAKGYQEPNSKKLTAQKTEYGYYFMEDTTVTIHAEDADPSSGIKTITYYTVDYQDEKKPVKSEEKTVKAEEDGEIKIQVKKNFKGQIYAKATDYVGNEPKNYVSPQATIVESPNLHKKTSSIQYTLPKTPYQDEKGNPLYQEDTKVKVEIVDSYSGIRQIDWRILADHDDKQQAGTVIVDNHGAVTSVAKDGYHADCLETWKIKKERNIVTKMTNTILVSNDCNEITIEFSFKDRVGNETKRVQQKLSIDKTASIIQVSMNQNDDEEFSGFFQEDRSAEITIYERNFKNENVVFDVVRTDENEVQIQENIVPQFVATMEHGKEKSFVDENGIEYYEYKMNYVFSNEGDYDFTISSKDKVQRENAEVIYSDPIVDKNFTLDKTAPVIQVSYDNNNAANGKYFQEARTATITVTEHNFEEARITYTRTSNKAGSVIGEPAVSGWSTNGNIHTATIVYDTEGDYTFAMTMNDKAGNADEGIDYGTSVSATEFTVDTTIEKPVIAGIENGKAYTDDVVPVISFQDINFETDEITLLRTTKDKKNEDVTEAIIAANMKVNGGGNGKNGTLDVFEKTKENDGIYTLKVKVADKAGNEETEEVVFTINRFGSVYSFGEYMISLQDTYVQEVTDQLVITEYNPSPLVRGSRKIQITCDGAPITDIQSNLTQVTNEYVPSENGGWYQYEYVIDTSNFQKDGLYKLFVSSEDEAGNAPDITNELGYDVMFHVDRTKPEITNIIGLEENTVMVDTGTHPVKFDVFDAMGLRKVSVYVDGQEVMVLEGEEIKENAINLKNTIEMEPGIEKKVRLVVEDFAGNVMDTDSKDFKPGYTFHPSITITTDELSYFFWSWYNKAWFLGSIVGILAAITGSVAGIFMMYRRRKEKRKSYE